MLRSQVYLAINAELKDSLFTAKTLLNNLKSDAYGAINVEALTTIFGLFKSNAITPVLMQHAIKELLKDSSFAYQKYFDENSVSEEKLIAAIDQVLEANAAIAEEIAGGNQAKAGQLIGKVIAITGKGADGKTIRSTIISRLASNSKSNSEEQSSTDLSLIHI